jgi:hypothetical protein
MQEILEFRKEREKYWLIPNKILREINSFHHGMFESYLQIVEYKFITKFEIQNLDFKIKKKKNRNVVWAQSHSAHLALLLRGPSSIRVYHPGSYHWSLGSTVSATQHLRHPPRHGHHYHWHVSHRSFLRWLCLFGWLAGRGSQLFPLQRTPRTAVLPWSSRHRCGGCCTRWRYLRINPRIPFPDHVCALALFYHPRETPVGTSLRTVKGGGCYCTCSSPVKQIGARGWPMTFVAP